MQSEITKLAELLSRVDAANFLLVNCMMRFLETKGLLERREFIAYLEATAERLEADGVEPARIEPFRIAIRSFEQERPTVLN